MTTVFESKLRRVGNSLAVIVPNGIIEEKGLKPGESVTLSIVPPESGRKEALRKMAGIAGTGTKAFRREHDDRF